MTNIRIEINSITTPPIVAPAHPLWRVKHDVEMYRDKVAFTGWGDYGGHERPYWRDGYPEVYWLLGSHQVPFNEAWQILSFQLNPNMSPAKWREVHDDWRAFHNGTGFPHPNIPGTKDYDPNYQPTPRADFINRYNLSSMLPTWDKIRVCGGATVCGIQDAPSTVLIETLDYYNPPTIDWLIARPWLYFHALSSVFRKKADGTYYKDINNNFVETPEPFPQNGDYPTLIPLIAMTEVRLPLNALIPVDKITDPYTC